MGANASLSSRTVSVEPGTTAVCELRIRNIGNVVDQFDFSVVGEVDGWLTVQPSSVTLLPATEGTAQVLISPPRDSSVPAGAVPFGIKVSSREDPAGSVVEEGTAQVSAFVDVFPELVPRTSRARRGARHELALDNRGNAPVHAELVPVDRDERLGFAVDPPAVELAPGTASFARVKVAPRQRIVKGPPVSHPFQVAVQPDGSSPVYADGTLVQEALIPNWGTKAAMGVLAALLAFALMWLTLLRPSIKSAAKDAADEAVAPVAEDAAASKASAAKASQDSQAAVEAVESLTGASLPTTTIAPSPSGGAGAGTAFDGRLFLTKAGTAAFTIPNGKVFELTDLVLQNPAGNSGTLNVRRNGTPLLVMALENFRDHDYHFVSPVVFRSGDRLELHAECKAPPDGCSPGLYYSGVMKAAAAT